MHALAPHGIAAAAIVVLVGCSPAPPTGSAPVATPHAHDEHAHDEHGHEDHDHPDTLAAGIAELVKVSADVKAKLASGEREAADDAVHALGHLLEDLEGLVAKAGLKAASEAAGKKAVADLYDCFDELDLALHAAEGAGKPPAEVHASLTERIEAAIASLRSLTP